MTRRAALGALAVAGLLLLSGCGGALGGDDAPRRGTFDVPETTASGGESEFDADDRSKTTGDSFDAFAVVENHTAALANTSVAVRESRVVRYSDGTVRYGRESEWYVGAAGGYYRLDRIDGTGEAAGNVPGTYQYERWLDGETGVERVLVDNETTYDPVRKRPNDVDRADRLFALLTVLEPTVSVRGTQSGGRVRVLRASAATAPETLDRRAVSRPRNVSFVAVVGPTGAVERYRLAYTGVVEGRTVRVVERVAFEVGETTVPRPDWVDEGLRATGQAAAAGNETTTGTEGETTTTEDETTTGSGDGATTTGGAKGGAGGG